MKNHTLRFVALSLLISVSVPSWAQPDNEPANIAPPFFVAPPAFPKGEDLDRAEDSSDALAVIGAFYHRLNYANSYRGRVVVETTTSSQGKVLSKKSVEMESSWIGDKEIQGAFKKEASTFVVTNTTKGETTINKFRTIGNGSMNYLVHETKNLWSERAHEEGETTYMFDGMQGPWVLALASFGTGRKLEIENQTVDGQDQILVQSKPENQYANQYVFDAKTGDLKSFTCTFMLGEKADDVAKVECRWLQHEFDGPLADSIFDWKTPEGAEKVGPKKIDIETYIQGP